MSLVLKVACPDCFEPHDANALGAEIRCQHCGRDFRAQADGEGASRILSVSSEEMENVPYSQRSTHVPVNSKSSIIASDPALLNDKLLMTAPMRNNSRFVGKVQLIKKIGQGGMGAVYQGFDESLALDVAVKILPVPVGQRDDQFVQRFRQEARISAKINHTNVVRTLHVDEEGELIYLVMDYVKGQTARSLCDSKGPLPYPQALQIVHDVALGVQAAHAHGVIHRDIKPDNILVADDGRIVLTDLGLAKAVGHGAGSRMPVTRMGLLMGTPEYMSPEQWEIGSDVGTASDIWSLGSTLWMLLTGKPPFVERDLALLSKRTREEPLPDIRLVRSDLPDCVLDILFRCLAKRPQERYMNCAELIAATQMALDELAHGKAQVTHRTQVIVAAPLMDRPSHNTSPLPQTPTVAVIAAPRPTLVIEKRAKQHPWKTWIGVPLLAASVAGAVAYFLPNANSRQYVVAAAGSLNLVPVSRQIKPGQEAEIAVNFGGPEGSTVAWEFNGQKRDTPTLREVIDRDTEFTAIARDKNGAELARRSMKIYVDLQVSAAERPAYDVLAGDSLKLAGDVRGGSADDVLLRWVRENEPGKVLSETAGLELTPTEPGSYTYVLQARRKSETDWRYAVSGRVQVNVARKISPEFTAAMDRAAKLRDGAFAAATGAEAVTQWQAVLQAYDLAAGLNPESDAATQALQARKQLDQEQKYVALLNDARRLKDTAEKQTEADGVARLAAWSDAQRPISAALVLYERGEARALSDAIEQKLKEMRAALQDAEQARASFDARVTRARTAVREAKKYLNPSVALPHWETAAGLFSELSTDYPQRAEEFTLERREADENRDKAYLYDKLGVVPSKVEERVQDIPVKPGEKPKVPSKAK